MIQIKVSGVKFSLFLCNFSKPLTKSLVLRLNRNELASYNAIIGCFAQGMFVGYRDRFNT